MIFSGYAAQDVTGSEIAINYNGKNILIECGMHQSSDILKAYNANIQKLPIKASKIDYVFVKGVKKVKQVHIPREKALNGVFLSDHNPVLSILSF